MTAIGPFDDTIFALSSGGLPSGVAVVRLSGPAVRATLEALAGCVPPARRAALATFRDAAGLPLDSGLCLFFPGPASATGEDCGELHLHGSRAVVAAVLETLSGRPGLRGAEPGEFTRRAFVNGKIDLTGAEALADLVAAETEAQRRFALANAQGGHRALYEGWRQRLLSARALIEAELDFADEADVPGSVSDTVWADVAALRTEIAGHAAGYRRAEIIREGYRVVILGPPNAGKSSLLNALARRDVAIVTDEPGTTRDVLEVTLDLDGVKVIVADTAGLRAAAGRVEALGIARALERAGTADLIVALHDATAGESAGLSLPPGFAGAVLRVANKLDRMAEDAVPAGTDVAVSVLTGRGLDALVARIGSLAREAAGQVGEIAPFRRRHVALLEEAQAHLGAATEDETLALELRAEELRLASAALAGIVGAIGTEDLLDSIFRDFCIGK
ncbi:tRNA uridine-5-carboxymethylaminomethyl(34) synthesis GTPase MnmE [Aquibium sp. A9E412]|uniref:tRNA uridine-5-carboxymethylaminomethyl(34) synthesis GTPase MnmE n=1 Tax=Aquibium sp. A9E412 TaxID=2976767 RepID=UPI0025B276EF|nr:tRNA uridine-5-carboxymethylaminomethyl(34) synthesis GTPase MnmE [Aquibium sp. A9E412]MDN2567393.1 tRNA uridine-5-carboxymethylaminomethyl(34) synthesis GTPase MnmE [Aquibium sp. A9E412]